jgi:antirestriction protein
MSILLHKSPRVFLMSHSDCATYGGLAAFAGDREREAAHHKTELQRAAQLIKDKFPDIHVQCFFVNFEGVFAACGENAEQAA